MGICSRFFDESRSFRGWGLVPLKYELILIMLFFFCKNLLLVKFYEMLLHRAFWIGCFLLFFSYSWSSIDLTIDLTILKGVWIYIESCYFSMVCRWLKNELLQVLGEVLQVLGGVLQVFGELLQVFGELLQVFGGLLQVFGELFTCFFNMFINMIFVSIFTKYYWYFSNCVYIILLQVFL